LIDALTLDNTPNPTNPHPLVATLALLPESYGTGEPSVRLGAPGDGGLWISAQGLIGRQSGLIDDAMAEIAATYNAVTRDAQASYFFGAHAWHLVTAALGPYLLANRVPDLSPANVWVAMTSGRATRLVLRHGRFACLPDDPAAAHPDAAVVADPDALLARLRAEIEAHLGALIGVMRVRRVPLGPRALWAIVSDYVLEVAIGLLGQDVTEERLAAVAAPLVRAPGSPLNGHSWFFQVHADRQSAFFTDRNGCCLNHKIPGIDRCSSCPLRPLPERVSLMRDYLNTLE